MCRSSGESVAQALANQVTEGQGSPSGTWGALVTRRSGGSQGGFGQVGGLWEVWAEVGYVDLGVFQDFSNL